MPAVCGDFSSALAAPPVPPPAPQPGFHFGTELAGVTSLALNNPFSPVTALVASPAAAEQQVPNPGEGLRSGGWQGWGWRRLRARAAAAVGARTPHRCAGASGRSRTG